MENETKECPQCKESILKNAKVCKHCNADLKSWFAKNKVITVGLVLFSLGLGMALFDVSKPKSNKTEVKVSSQKSKPEIKKETPTSSPEPTPTNPNLASPHEAMSKIGKEVSEKSNVSVFPQVDGSIDVTNNIIITPEINSNRLFDTSTRQWVTEFLQKTFTSDYKIRHVLITVSFVGTSRPATRVALGINQAKDITQEQWKDVTPYDLCNWLKKVSTGENPDYASPEFTDYANSTFTRNYNCS